MASIAEFYDRLAVEYAAAVARGEHDEQCEYDPRGFYICHCKKRQRLASGFTNIADAGELYFAAPDCPRCYKTTVWDEGFYCSDCHVRWGEGGGNPSFTDEYGDDLAERSAEWKARLDKREQEQQSQDRPAGVEE